MGGEGREEEGRERRGGEGDGREGSLVLKLPLATPLLSILPLHNWLTYYLYCIRLFVLYSIELFCTA